MNIQIERHDQITVLRPVGRLDSATSSSFEKAVTAAFDGGARWMVLDFEALEYISSAGVRSALVAGKRARGLPGGRLLVCSMNQQVGDIFRISGFIAIFEICENLPAALARFTPA